MSDEAHTLADSMNEPVCSFAGDGADHGHAGPLLPRPSPDDPRFWLCGRCFNTSANATEILKADVAAVTLTDSVATVPPPSAEPPGIATQPRILDRIAEVLRWQGVVGEVATAATIYLAVTSRLLDKPVSLAVKGHSSSGKSLTVDKVLALFPARRLSS